MRILITEDDSVGRRVLQLFIQPFGEVQMASRGDEALGLFFAAHKDNRPFGLVLLDIGLPGQGGLDVLKEIRAFETQRGIGSPVPVIMLTGNTGEDQITAARNLGASKYLLKPVIESELLEQLKALGIITPKK